MDTAADNRTTDDFAEPGPVSARGGRPISFIYAACMLAITALIVMLHNVDRQIVSILLVPIQKDLHVSDTAMGLLTGFAFATVYVTAGIPIAFWSDRGNRVNILSISIAVWSVATALCGVAMNYGQLVLARMGVALGEAAANPTSISLISDLFSPYRRATALSLYYVGAASGIFIGMWFGGWISEISNWRVAFMLAGAPGLVLAVVARATMTEPARGGTDAGTAAREPAPSFLCVQRTLWSLPTYKYLVFGNAFHALAMYGLFAWTAAFIVRVHGLGMASTGFWVGLMTGAGSALGNLLGGYVSDRSGSPGVDRYLTTAGLANILAVPLVAVFALSGSIEVVLISFFVMTGLIASSASPIGAVTQAIVPPNMRSLSFSTQYMITSLIGMGGGPLLVGVLNDQLAPYVGLSAVRYSLLAAVTVTSLACGLFFLAGSRAPGRIAGD